VRRRENAMIRDLNPDVPVSLSRVIPKVMLHRRTGYRSKKLSGQEKLTSLTAPSGKERDLTELRNEQDYPSPYFIPA
jgi:hypothetical protein